MNAALESCLALSLLLLLFALGCTAWRFVRGPSVLDRILAFDLCAVAAVGILVLLSLWWETNEYLELLLVYALLGFSTSASFTTYLIRSESSEREVAGGEPTDADEP